LTIARSPLIAAEVELLVVAPPVLCRRRPPRWAELDELDELLQAAMNAASDVAVTPGTRVTFTNRDRTSHTATSSVPGGFDTGTVKPGASATVTVRRAGTDIYACQFHPLMHGFVIVR
jgi:hypothetical protein